MIFNFPYEKTISCFQEIEEINNPIQKLKCIVKISQCALNEIKTFYSKNDFEFDEKIEHSDFNKIILYIIINAKIKEINTHFEIIEEFCPKFMLTSFCGYYFYTFRTCINQIESSYASKNFTI